MELSTHLLSCFSEWSVSGVLLHPLEPWIPSATVTSPSLQVRKQTASKMILTRPLVWNTIFRLMAQVSISPTLIPAQTPQTGIGTKDIHWPTQNSRCFTCFFHSPSCFSVPINGLFPIPSREQMSDTWFLSLFHSHLQSSRQPYDCTSKTSTNLLTPLPASASPSWCRSPSSPSRLLKFQASLFPLLSFHNPFSL